MPQQVNKKEKSDLLGGDVTCAMEASGWSFRRLNPVNSDIASVAIHGQEVILVEDIGTPYQTLKPIQGDFGVISRFMHDGERWLEKHGQPGIGMNAGHSKWLEWKQMCLDQALTPDDFFEGYLSQENSLTLSVI